MLSPTGPGDPQLAAHAWFDTARPTWDASAGYRIWALHHGGQRTVPPIVHMELARGKDASQGSFSCARIGGFPWSIPRHCPLPYSAVSLVQSLSLAKARSDVVPYVRSFSSVRTPPLDFV